MPIVFYIFEEAGIQGSIVPIYEERQNGTTTDLRKDILSINVFEDFDKNLSVILLLSKQKARECIVSLLKVYFGPPG